MDLNAHELERDARRVGTFGPARLAGELEGHADQRPPLVLLHGLTFDRSMWRPALANLRMRDPGRQVLALDLPGHGESPEQDSYTLERVASDVSLAVDDAGLAPPVLVGHSIAAVIATVYASRYPARGVVNVDQTLRTAPFLQMLKARAEQITGPGFPALWQELSAGMQIEPLPTAAQQLIRSTSRPRQHIVAGYWQQALEQPLEQVEQLINGTLAATRRDGRPYLIVAGSKPPPDYQNWLSAALPHATITVINRGGHFPHLADPDKFAEHLAATGRWTVQTGETINRPPRRLGQDHRPTEPRADFPGREATVSRSSAQLVPIAASATHRPAGRLLCSQTDSDLRPVAVDNARLLPDSLSHASALRRAWPLSEAGGSPEPARRWMRNVGRALVGGRFARMFEAIAGDGSVGSD
jgi:pimeloyl-ACP methyl ester carboxylesterase